MFSFAILDNIAPFMGDLGTNFLGYLFSWDSFSQTNRVKIRFLRLSIFANGSYFVIFFLIFARIWEKCDFAGMIWMICLEVSKFSFDCPGRKI